MQLKNWTETCRETFVREGVLHNTGLGNLNVQSLKNLEPGESLKKYRMLMKCHAMPHWPCMLSHPANEHLAPFLVLLLLGHFCRDARKNAFWQEVRSLGVIMRAIFQLRDRFIRFEFLFGKRLLRVFLITIAPGASAAVDFFLVDHNASVSVKERLYVPFFFANEFSGPRSRKMTSSFRNKRIQFSGKENRGRFSNNVL